MEEMLFTPTEFIVSCLGFSAIASFLTWYSCNLPFDFNYWCKYKNCFCVPDLRLDSNTMRYSTLGMIAKHLYMNDSETLEDGRVEVTIDLDSERLINLSREEIEIIEGILMVNGHKFYEVSASANADLKLHTDTLLV